jgi:hypothetical protein
MLVGRALGGRPGQRLLSRLGMRTRRHTVLRQVTRTARRSASQNMIRVLGVDDWAKAIENGPVGDTENSRCPPGRAGKNGATGE